MQPTLVVLREVERCEGELRVREEDLSLSADGRSLVLNCYFESYRPQAGASVMCSYQVSLAAFTHWMITCGELRLHQT